VKIITGIRRCGKSYLLFELFTKYLHEIGVAENQIIHLALDEFPNAKYRNPIELDKYIREQIIDKSKKYYVMIDEIQFVTDIKNPYVDDKNAKLGFIDVVLGLMKIKNDTEILDNLLDIVASSIGSLTNPTKLSNTFLSEKKIRISSATISKYLEYFEEAFLISRAKRYDVKGKKYIQTPLKYYYTDSGCRCC
jgi:predicted AAA+ superfamily ATPase